MPSEKPLLHCSIYLSNTEKTEAINLLLQHTLKTITLSVLVVDGFAHDIYLTRTFYVACFNLMYRFGLNHSHWLGGWNWMKNGKKKRIHDSQPEDGEKKMFLCYASPCCWNATKTFTYHHLLDSFMRVSSIEWSIDDDGYSTILWQLYLCGAVVRVFFFFFSIRINDRRARVW